MSIGGGCSAEIFASRIDDDRSRLMSATIAAAKSVGPRSDQSFSVMKACAVFMPWPEKLKPVRKVTFSTPGRLSKIFLDLLDRRPRCGPRTTSDGVCTSVVTKPWSSIGRKPPGRLTKAQDSADQQRDIDQHQAAGALQRAADGARIAVRAAFEHAVEPAEEALLRMVVAGLDRLQQRRAQRRRQRQRQEARRSRSQRPWSPRTGGR